MIKYQHIFTYTSYMKGKDRQEAKAKLKNDRDGSRKSTETKTEMS